MRSSRPLRLATLAIVGSIARLASAQPAPAPAPPQPAPAPAPTLTVTVTGHVIDKLGRPIRGAEVSVQGLSGIVKTDAQGRFTLANVPTGATVVVIADGYETGLGAALGGAMPDIVLLSEHDATETIEVHGEPPPAAPGAAKLDRTELQRIPGTGNDVVRALTAMPGVVNFELPLGYAGVVIRGASPQDSKILIDDFEVPTLYHDIGFRSIVPAEAIASLDYIPGGFDVAYGHAASGIVALTTRPGADTRSEQAEVSVIDGGLIAQGPAGKDTTYMIAFRRSLIDLLLPELIPPSVDLSLTTVPRYYDEQIRIDHALSARWKLRVSSVGSDDLLELYTDKTKQADQRFYSRTRFVRLTTAADYHGGPWSSTLALSMIASEFVFDSGVNQHLDVQQPAVNARGEITRTAKDLAGLSEVAWRAGGEVDVTANQLDLALPNEKLEGEPQGMFDPNDTSERYRGTIWTPDFAAWTALAAGLDPRIRFTLGLRADEFARIHAAALEPRGELNIKLAPELTARLAAGEYRRPPEYQTELLVSTVKPEGATQLIGGLTWQPESGVRVQGSLYYTDRTDLIVHAADGMTLVNDGRGTTYGAELLATYRRGPWFAWLSYSYSHSTRVDHPGAPARLFDYDQPHSLNLAASYRWKRWQLGGRFQLYSGLPYTPVTGSVFESDANTYLPIYGPVNSERAPIHHQLDVRVDHYWTWGPAQMSWFLDVQNVYLDESTVAYFYSYDYTQRAAFRSLPIIPSIGLRGVL